MLSNKQLKIGTGMNRISTSYEFASIAEEVAQGVSLSGQRAIVTGGASGIGTETARVLAAIDADVTLAVRNLEAGEKKRRSNHRPDRQQKRPRFPAGLVESQISL
jgi:short subunit dehydrogenase